MSKYGESVYGTSATNIPEQSWGVTTRRGNELYLHLIEPLEGCPVIQVPIEGKVKSVVALEDGAALKYKVSDGKLDITLPKAPDCADYVIKILQ
jgi:alpha-L-fucosidase